MSHGANRIDLTTMSKVEETLALLKAHIAKVPEPDQRLLEGIDALRGIQRLAEFAANPIPKRHAMISQNILYTTISRNITTIFFHRRADGIPALILPEHIEQKLASLNKRAMALSAAR